MGTVTQQIHIDAPAAQVWAVLEDVRLLPRFSASTVAVDAPPRLFEAGQRFDQTVDVAGRHFTSTWRVDDIEPGRRLVLSGSVLPGTSYTMTETVLPSGPCASTLTLRMQYKLPFGPLGRLAAHLGVEQRATDEAQQVLEGVKAHTEALHQSEWTAVVAAPAPAPDERVDRSHLFNGGVPHGASGSDRDHAVAGRHASS
jgi:uncharacterized protein YndB with AHSA1/START domain